MTGGASEELATCVANRSAALFHVGRHRECLCDIEYALTLGYPEKQKEKLIKRKLACQQELAKQAKSLFGNKETSSPFITDKEVHRGLDYEKLKKLEKEPVFRMVTCEGKGKALVATRKISSGEPILAEKPFVSVPSNLKQYCYHCLRRVDQLDQPTPCVQCSQVRFCSKSCAADSWNQYHSYECCHLDILNISQDFHYAPKLTLRALIKTGIDKVLTLNEGSIDEGEEENGKLKIPTGYPAFLDMIEHSEKDSNDYSIASAIIAAFILEKVAKNQDIVFSRSSIASLFERITKHLCQVNVNAITITGTTVGMRDDHLVEDGPLYSESNVGCGVYLTCRLINHSCDPNSRITRFENGDTLVLYAVKDIEEGEEITFSYGGSYKWQILSERKKMLRQSYFFDCTCSACMKGLQPINSALKCNTCAGPVVSDGTMICLTCGQKDHIDVSTVIAQMTDCIKIIKLGNAMLEKAEGSDNPIDLYEVAEKSFVEAYSQMNQLVHSTHNEITKVLQLRLKVCAKLKKIDDCVTISEQVYTNLSSQYHVTYYKVFNSLLILLRHQVSLYQELKKKKPLNKNRVNAVKSSAHVNLDVLSKAYAQISTGQDAVILERIKRSCKLLSCQPIF